MAKREEPWTATWDKDRKILHLWITPNRGGLIYNVKSEDKCREYIEETGVTQELVIADLTDNVVRTVGEVAL